MRKFFLFMSSLVLSSIIFSTQAQNYSTGASIYREKGVDIGIKPIIKKNNIVGDDFNYAGSTRIGYNVGVVIDADCSDYFFIESGLSLLSKGSQTSNGNAKITLNYLELPILLGFKTNITDNIRWYVNAGPYLACGIFGKSSVDIGYGYESTTNVWEDGDFGFKRFDAGLTFGTGFLFHQVRVGVAYDLGLVNVISGGNIKNRSCQISLGYNF